MCDTKGFLRIAMLILTGLLLATARSGWAQDPNGQDRIEIIDRYVAVDNVCAWPNLVLLPDGTILAFIFDQPNHGNTPGDVACWASVDGGRLWKHRSTATQHEPGTIRVNHAVGLGHDGDILLLVSGWGNDKFLDVWICRSHDNGRTWTTEKNRFPVPEGMRYVIPFGDVIAFGEKDLAVSAYSEEWGGGPCTALLYFSGDNGRSWPIHKVISPGKDIWGLLNETCMLRLQDGRWLAGGRTKPPSEMIKCYLSQDEGDHWEHIGDLTENDEHPGDFTQLKDGRILLTYGDRQRPVLGLKVRVGDANGRHWQQAQQLIDDVDGTRDCGYPSTVQLSDGTLVTAYYAKKTKPHSRYHMAIVRWRLVK